MNVCSTQVPKIKPTAREKSRQDFVVSLRKYATQTLGAGVHDIYQSDIEPSFEAANGRKPESLAEVKELMTADSYYQFWSAVQRNSQEMVWDSVVDTTERHMDDYSALSKAGLPLGSLRLNPDLQIPKYHDTIDIHLMPGGYHTEQVEDDVAAGMIYDLGVPVYSLRRMGEQNDSNGLTLANGFKNLFPNREVGRVLDVGCAIGNSTIAWAEAFPEAEVHGIDIGGPCLRYGHVRANRLGLPIELSQQNASRTDFPDDHFDVIASALLFHETSSAAIPEIMKEMMRILKPGGVMIHFDGFKLKADDPLTEFLGLWETYNNNEYFLRTLQNLDIVQIVKDTGLEATRFESQPYIRTAKTEGVAGRKGYMAGSGVMNVDLLVAEKPIDSSELVGAA